MVGVERYMDGDQNARKLMMQISLRLACTDIREG